MTYRTTEVEAPVVEAPPATPLMPDPAKVVAEAAAVIEEYGWTTGSWQDENGHVCALGAINVAAVRHLGLDESRWIYPNGHFALPMIGGPKWQERLETWKQLHLLANEAALVMQKHIYGHVGGSVWVWNDRQSHWFGRGRRKVIETMRAAAGK